MLKYRITTPEQVAFHYNVAGIISRGLAWLIDYCLIWAGCIAIAVTFLSLGGAVGVLLVILGVFVIDFSYFTFFELYWSGQTPGKRLFHIRVISTRGSKLRFNDVLIRNLVRPVDMLPFSGLIGAAVAIADRWHRRLGDFAADTIIIRDARHVVPEALVGQKTRINTFATDAELRGRILTRITRDERDLVMDLAVRRDQMDPGIREELFSIAARHFRSRFALPEDMDYLSDEQTVLNLALVVQDAKFAA